MAVVAVGAIVAIPHLRLEAVVDAVSERGVRVLIDGPSDQHELYGASMWVASTDAQALKPAKQPCSVSVGSSVIAKLPDGETAEAVVLDVRQGLRRGAVGLRVQVKHGDESMWLRAKDVTQPPSSNDDAEAMAPAGSGSDSAAGGDDQEIAVAEEGEEEEEEEAAVEEAANALDADTEEDSEEESDGEEAAEEGGDGEEESDGEEDDDEEELEENEAVLVRWKQKRSDGAKEYNGVVAELRRKQNRVTRVRVQFDYSRQHAWLPPSSVRVMPEADGSLPVWARAGAAIEAIDPFGSDAGKWHGASVDEVRRGVDEGQDDGMRLWVRYSASGLCQWLNSTQVRPAGTSSTSAASANSPAGTNADASSRPALSAAVDDEPDSSLSTLRVVGVSRSSGQAGDGLWLLLSDAALDKHAHAAACYFGEAASAETWILAANVVACIVPADAPVGPIGVRLTVQTSASTDAVVEPEAWSFIPPARHCSMRFEVT